MNNRHDWMSKVNNKAEQFHDHRMFCDEAWQLLSDVCQKTNAKVVLSSSWRIGFTYDVNGKVVVKNSDCFLSNKLMEYFNNYNIELIGITTDNYDLRGIQISNYIYEYLTTADKFVILDDEIIDIECIITSDLIIKTEFETGLLPEHCEKIIKYFMED